MIGHAVELQRMLFEQGAPSRRALLEYKKTESAHGFKICVYRNHSFELIENTISAYLDYAECPSSFEYSDYDDSLSFINFDNSADMCIVWLDLSRYLHVDDINEFLSARMAYLNAVFGKPVLFAYCGGEVEFSSANVLCLNVDSLCARQGVKTYDERMEGISGTRLSSKAMMSVAKEIGLKFIPSMLRPALKAIAVDLDNTLYCGVLGEDGVDGVRLTDGHVRLQNALKALKSQGFFLCAISKNDIRDVERLFAARKDFPLGIDDFVSVQASWEEKSALIRNILSATNIHYDSVLFVDDNVGELNAMDLAYPDIHCVRACDDANITADIIENYPRLRKFGINAEDALRSADTKANAERAELRRGWSQSEYLKTLDVRIRFGIDEQSTAERVFELANKTNQFIFNYRRYGKARVEEMIRDSAYRVITVSLKDKLSDSGIVGVCVANLSGRTVCIDELFVSCRALGRGLDDIIVLGAISVACEEFKCDTVKVAFKKGERNLPAEKFVEKELVEYTKQAHSFEYEFPADLVNIEIHGRE